MILNFDIFEHGFVCKKNDSISKTFFIIDDSVADESYLSYLHKKDIRVSTFLGEGGFAPLTPRVEVRPQTPDALGLKLLKPTGSREVLVNVSEPGLQNLLRPRNFA